MCWQKRRKFENQAVGYLEIINLVDKIKLTNKRPHEKPM